MGDWRCLNTRTRSLVAHYLGFEGSPPLPIGDAGQPAVQLYSHDMPCHVLGHAVVDSLIALIDRLL